MSLFLAAFLQFFSHTNLTSSSIPSSQSCSAPMSSSFHCSKRILFGVRFFNCITCPIHPKGSFLICVTISFSLYIPFSSVLNLIIHSVHMIIMSETTLNLEKCLCQLSLLRFYVSWILHPVVNFLSFWSVRLYIFATGCPYTHSIVLLSRSNYPKSSVHQKTPLNHQPGIIYQGTFFFLSKSCFSNTQPGNVICE